LLFLKIKILQTPFLCYNKGDFLPHKIPQKEDKQTFFFDTDFACAHLIDKNSLYAKRHDLADKVIKDNDFVDIYCLVMAGLLYLQQELLKFLSYKPVRLYLIEKLLRWYVLT